MHVLFLFVVILSLAEFRIAKTGQAMCLLPTCAPCLLASGLEKVLWVSHSDCKTSALDCSRARSLRL